MQAGVQIVNPKGLYALVSKMTTNAGFKNPEEFWQDPSSVPPQPPQPNPLIQVEQMKQQGKMQELQITSQLEQQKAQANLQQEQLRSANDAELERQKVAAQIELERWKAELDAQVAMEKAKIDAETKLAIEQIKASNQQSPVSIVHDANGSITAELGSQTKAQQETKDTVISGLQMLMQQQTESMNALVGALTKPKQIVRGPDGRAIGVQ